MSDLGPLALGPGAEFELIARVLRDAMPSGARARGVVLGGGDDAAVLAGGWVVSTDLHVEDVHFRRRWMSHSQIGSRAAATALSDMAAMGAAGVACLVSVASPSDAPSESVVDIMSGVKQVLDRYGAALIGGDLARSHARSGWVIDVVCIGRADPPWLRSGARPGDELWVTGRLGGAAAALRALEAGGRPTEAALAGLVGPVPRIVEARWLRERVEVRAAIDLSDGLVSDGGHLAAASGVRVVLDVDSLPVHDDVPGGPVDRAATALTGGDDYELLLAAPEGALSGVQGAFGDRFGVGLTRVGTTTAGTGVVLDGASIPPEALARLARGSGYDHFEKDRSTVERSGVEDTRDGAR